MGNRKSHRVRTIVATDFVFDLPQWGHRLDRPRRKW